MKDTLLVDMDNDPYHFQLYGAMFALILHLKARDEVQRAWMFYLFIMFSRLAIIKLKRRAPGRWFTLSSKRNALR